MFSIDRQNQIVKIISEKGSASIKELSSILNVTEMTINRDLKKLQNQNLIKRVHGGATCQRRLLGEIKFSERIYSHIKEKEMIAKKAVEHIKEGDSLILYGSTTTLILAKEIARKNISNITVVTNSDYMVNELKMLTDITIISTGGEYIPKLGLYSGMYAEMILSEIRINKIFFSVAGLSFDDGLTDSEPSEISLKNKMFEISGEKILILTSDKFNCSSIHKLAPLSMADRIITDKNVSKEDISKIKEMGIAIEIASE